MEVDMDLDSDSQPKFVRPTISGINSFLSGSGDGSQTSNPMPYSTQSLSRRLAPNSIGLQMTPTKMLSNQTRRSSSGIFITSMFGSRFRHLQKLHSEAFLGLNSICLPGLPIGAVFRSSLPATPVATPIHREAFQHFSEQAIRERLCRTPSPRKNRQFLNIGCHQTEQTSDHQMRSDSQFGPESGLMDVQPMDITSPIIDEPVIEDTKGEESGSGGQFDENFFKHSDQLERMPSDLFERRLFVGNISYRIKEWELSQFFRKFGKVYNCCIVNDHLRKRPKGYGFITFETVADSQSVLNANPDQLILDNRQLRVFRGNPKKCSQMKKEVQHLTEERHQWIQLRDSQISGQSSHVSNYEKRDQIFNFNDLDDDVILHIFSHLNDLKDRTLIEFVCKRWKNLAINLWSSAINISFMSTFFNFGCPALETTTLFSILKKCPNLHSIDLRNVCNFLDSKALEIIAVSCPHLETLYYESGVATDYGLRILGEKCPKLKNIYLNQCINFSEKGLWWLLKNAINLEILEIRGNHRLNGNCFRVLSQTLQSLDISDCIKIQQKGISELVAKNRSALKYLSFSQINYDIMKMICFQLKNLTVLRISNFTPLNQTNETLIGFRLISELKNLEILESYAIFSDINDTNILSIFENCVELKELVLKLDHNITDKSMARIPELLPHLRKLCATDSNISDQTLIEWSALNDLKCIEINRCFNITDTGVQYLVLNLKSVLLVKLNECENISIFCIKYLMETISSDSLYPEIIVVFENIRINTKKDNFKDIEESLNLKDRYLFCDSEEEYNED